MFQEQEGSTFNSMNAAIPYNITLCSSSKGIAQLRVLFELKDTTLTFVDQELTIQKPHNFFRRSTNRIKDTLVTN
jgi:hypothetical protein